MTVDDDDLVVGDRDGVVDTKPGSPALQDAIRAGGAAYATAMHALDPDLLLLAGQSGWDADAGVLDQAYAGGTWGELIGEEGTGFENRNGFAAMMTEYQRALAHSAPPKLFLFQQGFSGARFGYASAGSVVLFVVIAAVTAVQLRARRADVEH